MNYIEKIDARQAKQYKKQTYIDFKHEAIIDKLNKADLEEKLDWLVDNKYTFIKHTTMRLKMPSKTYSLTYNNHLVHLTYFDGLNYYWYSTNYHDDAKNIFTPNSFTTFKKMFKTRTGLKMDQAFGKVKQEYKLYCPKPLYYCNEAYEKGIWYKNIHKSDFSSHYPASATMMLPDANTAIEINEYTKPTKELPFAFYPDTGHVAVYEEFDSHEWKDFISVYSANTKQDKYVAQYRLKDTKTILMCASDFTLEEEIMHYYNLKQSCDKESTQYHDAKIFLLKFIGMMEQCSPKLYASYPFAHLAAVIKWRSNIRMFKLLREIGNGNIIQVCVDGVIYAGEPKGTTYKGIGSLQIEMENCKFVQRGINQYIIRNEHNEERKHQGLDINTHSDCIMNWLASPKVDFLTYLQTNYLIEELHYAEN